MMPRLMPGLIPKSSPVMMSHFMSVSPLRRLPPLTDLLPRRAHLPGLADLAPEGFQTGPPMFVVLDQADCQLKPYGRPGREVLVFQERDVLLLVDGLSPELECASPPVGDRRL